MRKFYLFSFESYHDENGHQEKVEMKPESQIYGKGKKEEDITIKKNT